MNLRLVRFVKAKAWCHQGERRNMANETEPVYVNPIRMRLLAQIAATVTAGWAAGGNSISAYSAIQTAADIIKEASNERWHEIDE